MKDYREQIVALLKLERAEPDRSHKDRIQWRYNNRLHRDYGPALEFSDGGRSWYKNGMLHREDGPAVEFADGSKEWYQNGLHHRKDGPAVEHADGHKEWWINGKQIPEPKKHQRCKKVRQ